LFGNILANIVLKLPDADNLAHAQIIVFQIIGRNALVFQAPKEKNT